VNLLLLTCPVVWFHLVVFVGLVGQCFHVSAACGLGNSSTRQTTITTENANSFNQSTSWANSFTGGDTSLNLGGGSESVAGTVGAIVPLMLAVMAGLGALWLLTRNK
jgi:hypothetical protein